MKYTHSSYPLLSICITSLLLLGGCRTQKKQAPQPPKKTDVAFEEFPLIESRADGHRSAEFDPAIESFVLTDDSFMPLSTTAQAAPEAPVDLAWNEPKTAHVVHFDYDSDKITASERAQLEPVIAQARETTEPIVLRGHACLYSPVATSQYNLVLSEKRGVAVKNELTKAGIEPERITVVGLGNEEPISTVMTKEAQAVNRRVQVTMVNA